MRRSNSVIVDDLNVVRVALLEPETDFPLIIDTDTVELRGASL
jgi:hypothetical protein